MAPLKSGLGFLTRAVFWASLAIIEGNALATSFRLQAWSQFAGQALFYPFVYVAWPWETHPGHSAWPWTDGTTTIPVLAAGLVAYAVSVAAGRPPLRTWGKE